MKKVYFLFMLLSPLGLLAEELPLQTLKKPPGFEISIYASPLPSARQMALGAKGTVFVGSLDEGKVYAILAQTKEIVTIASDLTMPSAVAFRNGSLYVAANDQILRFD